MTCSFEQKRSLFLDAFFFTQYGHFYVKSLSYPTLPNLIYIQTTLITQCHISERSIAYNREFLVLCANMAASGVGRTFQV